MLRVSGSVRQSLKKVFISNIIWCPQKQIRKQFVAHQHLTASWLCLFGRNRPIWKSFWTRVLPFLCVFCIAGGVRVSAHTRRPSPGRGGGPSGLRLREKEEAERRGGRPERGRQPAFARNCPRNLYLAFRTPQAGQPGRAWARQAL